MFYLKLAWSNIRKSKSIFAPFVLVTLVLYTLICSVVLIMLSPVIETLRSGAMVLPMAMVVLIIFAIIMELYSYNFLLKQRSREFGLYNILGMNKKQVSIVATLELLTLFLLLAAIGSIFSSFFSRLQYWSFTKLIKAPSVQFDVEPLGFLLTIMIFAGIFFLLELRGLRFIGKTSPLSLFRNQEKAEKEPKGNGFLAILGIILLGSGYYLSISSAKLEFIGTLYQFFFAVILVILGTYLFYISFTTWYLKKKRKNQQYFYQPEHFISTSQMLFRMKQNAIGLANITLLAIMAFVTIGTTSTIYTGMADYAKKSMPRNTSIDYTSDNLIEGEKFIEEQVLPKLGKTKTDGITYESVMLQANRPQGNSWKITQKQLEQPDINNIGYPYLVTQDAMRAFGNDFPSLQASQVAIYVSDNKSEVKTLDFLGQHYQVVKNFSNQLLMPDVQRTVGGMLIVVSNRQELEKLRQLYLSKSNGLMGKNFSYTAFMDLTPKEQEKAQQLISSQNNPAASILTKEELETEINALSGGFLFIGFLLGFSFMLGAALIIYYKQYTEGKEDKKSYKILQEVGMSQSGVKKVIQSQTLFVFFMPLLLAIIHFLAALPAIMRMLTAFAITEHSIIFTTSALSVLVIIVIYFGIYRATSRVYYRIVER